MSREEDLMHNKKDWLVGRILDLEKANHEYCIERDKLSKELKQPLDVLPNDVVYVETENSLEKITLRNLRGI